MWPGRCHRDERDSREGEARQIRAVAKGRTDGLRHGRPHGSSDIGLRLLVDDPYLFGSGLLLVVALR